MISRQYSGFAYIVPKIYHQMMNIQEYDCYICLIQQILTNMHYNCNSQLAVNQVTNEFGPGKQTFTTTSLFSNYKSV